MTVVKWNDDILSVSHKKGGVTAEFIRVYFPKGDEWTLIDINDFFDFERSSKLFLEVFQNKSKFNSREVEHICQPLFADEAGFAPDLIKRARVGE